jgi:hypothetical protein
MCWKRVSVEESIPVLSAVCPCFGMTNLRRRLALVQMELILGMALSKFSVAVDELQPENEMEGLQMAVLAPSGGRCLLRFSEQKAGAA